jgi:hypothetical protein
VENFQHIMSRGPGYQNILGWYKDEAQYQLPVTDSEFHITAVGNGMPIINRAGGRETPMTSRTGELPDSKPVPKGWAPPDAQEMERTLIIS